jgi:hypothetical protein
MERFIFEEYFFYSMLLLKQSLQHSSGIVLPSSQCEVDHFLLC